MKNYVDKDKLQEFATKLHNKQKTIFAPIEAVGAPLMAATVAEMTDQTKIYVYTGSETGYTNGNWYYYDGSAWTSGGVYNSAAIETDKTLSVENKPADAKKTGDEIIKLKNAIIVGNNDSDLLQPNISSGTDLNDVTIGTYKVINNATAQTLINIPVPIAGRLYVLSITTTTRRAQIYFTISNRIFFRYYDDSTWYQWKEINKVDDTLTLANIAAESKAVGDALSELKNIIPILDNSLLLKNAAADSKTVLDNNSNYGIYKGKPCNYVFASGTTGGGNVVYTRTDNITNEITLTGYNSISQSANINVFGATNTKPILIGALGERTAPKVTFNCNDSRIRLNVLVYISDADNGNYIIHGGESVILDIPETTTAVLFRYQIPTGTDNIDTIASFDIEIVIPYWVNATGDTTNMYNRIRRRLNYMHKCILGVGDYYINTGLTLNRGDVLTGSGINSRLIFSESSGNAITGTYDCEISNISILGDSTDITIETTEGNKHGLVMTGEDSTSSAIVGMRVYNCSIEHFTGSGLKINSTGYPTRGFLIDNCHFRNCWAGINISKKSEYWKISNCISRQNYYGIIDNGGNNMISNCGFDSNEIGMWIDNVDGTHTNNTHGSICNSSFNHNSTMAIYATGGIGEDVLQSGMVFTGCQIWYGGISLSHVFGFSFCNCNLGNTVPIDIDSSQSILFSNCLFRTTSDSPITVTNSTDNIIKFFNCYTRYGTLIPVDPV